MADENFSGFSLVSLPSPKIVPLGILYSTGTGQAATTGANITSVFPTSSSGLPLLSDEYAISSDQEKSVQVTFSVKVHGNLMQSFLSYIGFSGALEHKNSSLVRVHLIGAIKCDVDEFQLDAYINGARASSASLAFKQKLEKEELYVITQVIKCKDFVLETLSDSATNASLDAKAQLQGEGGFNLESAKANKDVIMNKDANKAPITVALRACRILKGKNIVTDEPQYRLRLQDELIKVRGIVPSQNLDSLTEIVTPNPS